MASSTSSATSATMSAISTVLSSSITSVTSSMRSTTATATSSSASATQTDGNGSGSDNGGGRPLLFFVALGFGVVFTNLWIIVGVKYCFRYNQRNRQAQIDAETGEPIDLATMPRPRRRREKKLMTMDEVNERFPLTKYKAWRAAREQQGLPAAGGVTAPPSRAGSIKEAMLERVSTEIEPFAAHPHPNIVNEKAQTDPTSDAKDFAGAIAVENKDNANKPDDKNRPEITTTETTASASTPAREDDDDDPIQTAAPNELLSSPGDACAICIDNIDDDDEVRGLTCGHAFHAGCLDPWLTNRRACCPLCKADYYIPKTRPPPTNNTDGSTADPNAPRNPEVIQAPAGAWMGLGTRGSNIGVRGQRVVFAGTRYQVDHHERFGFPVLVRDFRPRRQQNASENRASSGADQPDATGSPEIQDSEPQSTTIGRRMIRGISARFRPHHVARHSNSGSSPPATPDANTATPAELEAGQATR